MLTTTADTVGRHDFLYTPCSPETFMSLYKTYGHHPCCFENLASNLRRGDEPNLIVGLTACSAEMSNSYRFKAIDDQIRREAWEGREGRDGREGREQA
jgi:uncharacterized protein YcgI (DUF1989 family)